MADNAAVPEARIPGIDSEPEQRGSGEKEKSGGQKNNGSAATSYSMLEAADEGHLRSVL